MGLEARYLAESSEMEKRAHLSTFPSLAWGAERCFEPFIAPGPFITSGLYPVHLKDLYLPLFTGSMVEGMAGMASALYLS